MKKLLILISLLSFNTHASEEAAEALGERLFNDFRFSAYFAKVSKGNVNHELKKGSPAVEVIDTLIGQTTSPFMGKATSCSSCHMVDQGLEIEGLGMRGYNDAAKRTPIWFRAKDQKTTTLRNTPALIGINSKYLPHSFVHFDGELDGIKSTVLGNFTGRNMGWLAFEKEEALKNVIRVLKEDNGEGELASEFGGSYRKILKGTDPSIEDDFRLSAEYRLDLDTATDEEILKKVEEYVFIYVKNIDFSTDEEGNYNGSAYDFFLKENGIPTGPSKNQSVGSYTSGLRRAIAKLDKPRYIEAFSLDTHGRKTQFKKEELDGLKIFLNLKNNSRSMCLQCHMPPLFSDGLYHNVGVSQNEYENIHGKGSLLAKKIPSLKEKEASKITFLDIPNVKDDNKVDFGAWNFFSSSKQSNFSNYMRSLFCSSPANCDDEEISSRMVGRIKTPTLRNLGHSAPYFHNGSEKDILGVLKVYKRNSELVRNRELVNPAPQLGRMNLKDSDLKNLEKFIKSLDEEYE
ncbi:cytochrome c peroxidase [Halobacteriovorax sp. HLS]|uniref:cytochrome c peroxidase n=1 Tax=Halobacteriovorax sp. HLS TaxID=2234000 RepID=UPI000FD90888|nr:cytochrome c peroxidase [Halobacteriovorax sp. HLS]